jgi:RNA polymerase-binding transcription factor DksA
MSEFTNESVTAIESLLDDVDGALERLRLGTYRTCQICSAPLDTTELEANPLLARCGDHLALA